MRRCRRLVGMLALLSLYLGGSVLLWSWIAPQPRCTFPVHGLLDAFSGDGRLVACFTRASRLISGRNTQEYVGPVRVWDLRTGAVVASFLGSEDHVQALQLSSTGRWLALQQGKDAPTARLHVFNLQSGQEALTSEVPDSKLEVWWMSLRFSPDDRYLAALTGTVDDAQLTVWDLVGNHPPRVLPGTWPPFAFSPDGRSLAANVPLKLRTDADNGELRCYELATGQLRGRYQFPRGSIGPDVLFSPDGALLCADGFEEEKVDTYRRTTCAWAVETGRERLSVADAWRPVFGPKAKSLALQHHDKLRGPGIAIIDTADGGERSFVHFPGPGCVPQIGYPAGGQEPLFVTTRDGFFKPNRVLFWIGMNLGIRGWTQERHSDVVEVRRGTTGGLVWSQHYPGGGTYTVLTPDYSKLLTHVVSPNSSEPMLDVWDFPPPPLWLERGAAIAGWSLLFAATFGCLRRRARRAAIPEVCWFSLICKNRLVELATKGWEHTLSSTPLYRLVKGSLRFPLPCVRWPTAARGR